nr:uncharacterized protein LOC113720722 [Coffea arabica]
MENKLAWEMAIERLANTSNDKIDKSTSATNQLFERIEGRMDQLTTMYRNIEVQINQIANSINNRNHGELPSKTEVNLREHINAINLRSGKTVEGPKFGEFSGKKDKEVANEEMKENQKDYVVIDIDLPPSNVPSYVHFLKDIISKKRKVVDNEIIALTEECSALIKNKLSPKFKDLRSFFYSLHY